MTLIFDVGARVDETSEDADTREAAATHEYVPTEDKVAESVTASAATRTFDPILIYFKSHLF